MKKKHKVILLVETSRSFGRQLLYGIARYSRAHGPWVFYKETGGMDRSISQLKGWKANGIIMRNPKQYEELLSLGIPTILVIHQKEYASGFPRITTHSKKIAEMAGTLIYERLTSGSKVREAGHMGAKMNGYEKGQKLSINKPVQNKSKKTLLIGDK